MVYEPCKFLNIADGARFTKNDWSLCNWVAPTAFDVPASWGDRRLQAPLNAHADKATCAKCPCYEKRGK